MSAMNDHIPGVGAVAAVGHAVTVHRCILVVCDKDFFFEFTAQKDAFLRPFFPL